MGSQTQVTNLIIGKFAKMSTSVPKIPSLGDRQWKVKNMHEKCKTIKEWKAENLSLRKKFLYPRS